MGFGEAPADPDNMPPDDGWTNPFGAPHADATGNVGWSATDNGQPGVLVVQTNAVDFVVPNANRRDHDKVLHLSMVYRLLDNTMLPAGDRPTCVGSDSVKFAMVNPSDTPFGGQGWRLFSATYKRNGKCPASETVTIPGNAQGQLFLIDDVDITTSCKKSGPRKVPPSPGPGQHPDSRPEPREDRRVVGLARVAVSEDGGVRVLLSGEGGAGFVLLALWEGGPARPIAAGRLDASGRSVLAFPAVTESPDAFLVVTSPG